MEIKSIEPVYGENYDKGDIFFTYHNESFVSKGIAYFTKRKSMSDVRVAHVGVVTGRDYCIEAHLKGGVQRSDLNKYFNEKTCYISFRRLNEMNDELFGRMLNFCESKVGLDYGIGLIGAQALVGSFFGHRLNKLLDGKLEEHVSKILDNKDTYICSELVAECLDRQPEFRDKGILADPVSTITPQEIFEDQVLFKPWKN